MIEIERRRGLLRAAWILTVLAVIIGSLLAAGSMPMQMLGRLHISDKLQHFGAYAVIAFLPAIHERWRFIGVMALCAIAMGVGLEFGQLHSPGRSFEVADIIADTLGVCFGLGLGIPARCSDAVRSLVSADRATYSRRR